MAGIYKAPRGFIGYPVANNSASSGTVVIDNTIGGKETLPDKAEGLSEAEENTAVAIEKAAAMEAQAEREQIIDEEIERIKAFYHDEGEKALAEAKQKAENIFRTTEQQAAEYAEQAKRQAEEIFAKAEADGFAKGHDDGYKKGLMKCKDMLLELKSVSEQIVAERAELYDEYESEIFDTVMEIVNRVTLNSLAQKDKAIVKKTVKEAGKAFRGSEYVKITLAKTDISEEMPADADFFKKLLTNVKTVEVEVLKDAPSGTVILDNGSEITDAGIMTQLKMIEELGKGKYRKAPSGRKRKKDAEAETAEATSVAEAVTEAETASVAEEPSQADAPLE